MSTEEIEELRAKLDKLERQQRALSGEGMPTEQDVEQFKARLYADRERHMDRAAHFSREDLRAMAAAAPPDVIAGIVADNRGGTVPRGVIPNTTVGNRGPVPARGSGWAREVPLGPMPGVAQADRLVDHQDEIDRHQRFLDEAKRLAVQKAAEPK